MKRIMFIVLAAVYCITVLGGCQSQGEASSESSSQSQIISSIISSQPSSSHQPISSKPSALPSSAVSSSQAEQSITTSSSEPGGGTDVPTLPESQSPPLWQLADVAFEKRVYGAESTRIYFRLTNKSEDVMYIMRDYEMEKMEGGVWIPIEGNHRLDSQSIQYAVEPGKSRLVGVPVSWLQQPSERYGDKRIPEGIYRLRVYINQHFWRTVPFEIQEDPLEEDTSLYEIRTLNEIYLTASESVNYEVINKTEEDLSFSYQCFLEKLEEDVWKRFEGIGGPDFIIIVEPNGIMRETFSLEPYWPLEPGEYRLVKTLARNTYYAPFTLVESLEQKEPENLPSEQEPVEPLPTEEPPKEEKIQNDAPQSEELQTEKMLLNLQRSSKSRHWLLTAQAAFLWNEPQRLNHFYYKFRKEVRTIFLSSNVLFKKNKP
jgi:hypothetical protein